jgi:hypothetical protein
MKPNDLGFNYVHRPSAVLTLFQALALTYMLLQGPLTTLVTFIAIARP